MAPVSRGASPDGSSADAALATAPTPAERAAPPAAARLPTLAVAAAPMAAPALENLVKFNKKIYCCQTMLETKRRKLLTRRSQPACGKIRRAARRSWPRRRSRPGHPAKTGRPGPPPSASWPRAPAISRRSRFESKRKTKFFFKEIFPPTTH